MKNIIKKFWKENLVVFLLMMGAGVSTTLASFVNATILNALIKFDFGLFLSSILKLVVVFSIFLIFTYFHIIQSRKTTQKMAKYLRIQITDRMSRLSATDFKKKNEGYYTSWLSNDISQIEDQGFSKFYELLSNSINLSLALIGLLYIHWSLLIITMIEVIIIMQLPNIFKRKMNEATVRIAESNHSFVSKTTNLLSGFSTFFIFNNLSYLVTELKKEFSNLEQAKNTQTYFMAKVAIIGGLGNVIGQISSYALTGYLALLGQVTIGMLTTTGSLSSSVFNTVGNLSQYIAAINSVEPLIDKINNTAEVVDINEDDFQKLPPIVSGVKFNDVAFGYNENQPIFKHVDYTFELGKKYAISGDSGTGKSTVLNLLIKNLKPSNGSISLNNTSIEAIKTSDLLNQITYIEQKPYVFNGTVRENISLGDNISDQKIKEVLKSVGLSNYADKLDLIITENGNNFSGGQKQRLALARGLVRDSKIILLDESTSSLDEKTATSIEKAILNLPDKLVIMISHHLNDAIRNELDGILNLNDFAV